jgi:hypothetical protein
MPTGVSHRPHLAVDLGVCDVANRSSRGQLLDQISEPGIDLRLGKSLSHAGSRRFIEALNDGEELFEIEPYVGDVDL